MNTPTEHSRGTSWRCRVRWHTWVRRYADDHAQIVVCTRCGREGDVYGSAWLPAR